MNIQLKETVEFTSNKSRNKWMADPHIGKYLDFSGDSQENSQLEKALFVTNYEIYNGKKLVGDIKVFGYKEDQIKRMAQFLIVLGEQRNKGIGTIAIALLLEKLRKKYISVYCYVNRYNLASIRMLQKNGFLIKNLKSNEVILYKTLI
jgi:RimJ/RimL family protein N-acetyltransferase